jgi:hypothetical protein
MSISRTQTMRAAVLGLGVALASTPVFAQSSFKVGEKEIQVHGSVQQGFVVGEGNNFLTMNTTDGSGAMTDGSFNLATQVTSKLRVGGQVYARNIGELGNGQVQLDWAFADYKFHSAFGVRGGKVKTPLGLYNDTQDMEFLHTWALLPQGVYPLDLRSVSIAHIGGDAYGTVSLKKAGSVQYNVYGGVMQDDSNGGYRYGVEDSGLTITSDIKQKGLGFDTRWSTPVEGLMTGYSYLRTTFETDIFVPTFRIPLAVDITPWQRHAVFGTYQKDRWNFAAELRRDLQSFEFTPAISANSTTRVQSWFGAGSFRVNDMIEVGSYHSRHVANLDLPASADNNHIYDTAVTTRFDLNRFWNVKVEGHFMDGYGDPLSAHGFYPRNNQQGLESQTKMLVVRTGVSF